jgi:hypothetical protein
MAPRFVTRGAPLREMARVSYLRTFVAGPAKAAPALRPPRVPLWGPRQPANDLRSNDYRNPVVAPQDTAPDAVSTDSVSASSDIAAPPSITPRSVQSTAVSIHPTERSPEPASKPPSTPLSSSKDDAPLVAQLSPVYPRPISQPHMPSARQGQMQTSPISASLIERSVVSNASHSESVANLPLSQAASSIASELRRRKNEASQAFAELAQMPRRKDRELATLEARDQKSSQSLLQPKSPDDIALRHPAAKTGSPVRLEPGSKMSEGREVAERERRADQDRRASIPALRAIPRSPGSSKQAELKPSGNSIHIGNVDIHILPPPAPVVRQPVGQRAAVAAMSRGFTSSFGLNQG